MTVPHVDPSLRQPDDPGIETPENPYAPVVFRDSEMGREVAFLGNRMVGQVLPTSGKLTKAYALVSLPDVPRNGMPATSIVHAKRILRDVVRDWIADAGLIEVRR